jgi:hypothetical protein
MVAQHLKWWYLGTALRNRANRRCPRGRNRDQYRYRPGADVNPEARRPIMIPNADGDSDADIKRRGRCWLSAALRRDSPRTHRMAGSSAWTISSGRRTSCFSSSPVKVRPAEPRRLAGSAICLANSNGTIPWSSVSAPTGRMQTSPSVRQRDFRSTCFRIPILSSAVSTGSRSQTCSCSGWSRGSPSS